MAIKFYTRRGGGAGAIGSTPSPSTAVLEANGNILACPLLGNTLDTTSNHTFTGTPAFDAVGYNGETVLDSNTGTSLEANSGTAHRIAGASGLTFGGFFRFVSPPQPSTPFLIVSGVSGGVGNINYGLVFVSGALNYQQGPAGQLQSLGWAPQSDTTTATAPSEGWAHVAMEIDSGRAAGRLYVNGKQFGSDINSFTAPGPLTSDDLHICGIGGAPAGELKAYVRNAFIADSPLGAAVIRQLAEESFGHGLPA